MSLLHMLAGVDYDPNPIDVTFPAGQSTATVQLPVILDNEAELDEQLNLMLVIPSEAEMLLTPGRVTDAVGIIKDSSGKHN